MSSFFVFFLSPCAPQRKLFSEGEGKKKHLRFVFSGVGGVAFNRQLVLCYYRRGPGVFCFQMRASGSLNPCYMSMTRVCVVKIAQTLVIEARKNKPWQKRARTPTRTEVADLLAR